MKVPDLKGLMVRATPIAAVLLAAPSALALTICTENITCMLDIILEVVNWLPTLITALVPVILTMVVVGAIVGVIMAVVGIVFAIVALVVAITGIVAGMGSHGFRGKRK